MKKFLLLGIGVVLVSGAVIISSSAYYYTKSCFDQGFCKDFRTIDPKVYPRPTVKTQKEYVRRVFSDRIGPWQYRSTKSNKYGQGVYHPSRRQDVTFYRQYQTSPLPYRTRLALQKQRSGHYDRANARAENTATSDRHVIRYGQYAPKYNGQPYDQNQTAGNFYQSNLNISRPSLSTGNITGENIINNAHYTLTIPAGFIQDAQGIYRKVGSSLAFQIREAGTCDSYNAIACMNGLSTQFRSSQGLYNTEDYHKDFRWNQIIHNDFTYSPTITENFGAQVQEKNNAYFTYTAVNPHNNKVVRIEAVSEAKDRYQAAQDIFRVFETLRLR
jgi:hypothetical protein